MHRIIGPAWALCALLVATYLSAQEAQPLFNGRDLTGWQLVNTPPQTWSVNDGMLICSGKPIGELRTRDMYQNFELELEWRHMVPKGNAGVFVWADDITAPGVPFHRGVEVQVLENAYGNSEGHTTHGDIFPIHGATMTPENGRRGSRAFPTEERSKPSPEWNHYKVVCQDGSISLAVNGKVVTKGKDASPRKGYICLESEGGIVHYRNVTLKKLPDTPIDPEHVAISDRGYHSIYTGLDLSGWQLSGPAMAAWQADDWTLHFDGSTQGQDARIEHQLASACHAAVVDFRFSAKSRGLSVEVAGAPIALSLDKASPYAAALNKVDQWNRIEVLVDKKVMLINGKEFPLATASANQHIVIRPDGAIDLANLYAR